MYGSPAYCTSPAYCPYYDGPTSPERPGSPSYGDPDAAAAGAEDASPRTGPHGPKPASSVKKRAREEEGEDVTSTASWQELLVGALAQFRRPASFAVAGAVAVTAFEPAVTITGGALSDPGLLALPLSGEQAAALLRDGAVVAQLPAAQLSLGPGWQPVLARTAAAVADALGVDDALGIDARLVGLALCGPGGTLPLPDPPAAVAGPEPCEWGTLLVTLPCAGGHAGGALTVRHAGREQRLDRPPADEAGAPEVSFAAWFDAGVAVEQEPLTAGRRLALVYRLARSAPGPPPTPVDNGAARAALHAAAAAWAAAAAAADSPAHPRCVIPLEAESAVAAGAISFEALRGRDAEVVAALLACPLLDVRLGQSQLLVKAPSSPHKRRRCGRWGDCEGAGCARCGGSGYAPLPSAVKEFYVRKWAEPPPGRPRVLMMSGDSLDEKDTVGGAALEDLFDLTAEPAASQKIYYCDAFSPSSTIGRTYYGAAVAVVWLRAKETAVTLLENVRDAAALLAAAPSDTALRASLVSALQHSRERDSADVVAAVLASLPRAADVGAAREAGVALLRLVPDVRRMWESASLQAAVHEYAAHAAEHSAGAAALERLAHKCGLKAESVATLVALLHALAAKPAPKAHAAVLRGLRRLLAASDRLRQISPDELLVLCDALARGADALPGAKPGAAEEMLVVVTCALGDAGMFQGYGIWCYCPSQFGTLLAGHAARLQVAADGAVSRALLKMLESCGGMFGVGLVAGAAAWPPLRGALGPALLRMLGDDWSRSSVDAELLAAIAAHFLRPAAGGADDDERAVLLAALPKFPAALDAAVAAEVIAYARRSGGSDARAASSLTMAVKQHARAHVAQAVALVRACAAAAAELPQGLPVGVLSALLAEVGSAIDAKQPPAALGDVGELLFAPPAGLTVAAQVASAFVSKVLRLHSRLRAAQLAAAPQGLPPVLHAADPLPLLARCAAVRAAAAGGAPSPCGSLMRAWAAWLEAATSTGTPPPDFAQPAAQFPQHAGIEEFLRSPEQSMVVFGPTPRAGFHTRAESATFSNQYFGTNHMSCNDGRRFGWVPAPRVRSYDARAAPAPSGSPKWAFRLYKPGAVRRAVVSQMREDAAELRKVQRLLSEREEDAKLQAALAAHAAQQAAAAAAAAEGGAAAGAAAGDDDDVVILPSPAKVVFDLTGDD